MAVDAFKSFVELLSSWAIPLLLVVIPVYGHFKKVKVCY